MKLKHFLLSLFALALLVSCSSDDDDMGSPIPIETAINYFPATVGNHWDYHNNINIPDQYQHESDETLTVSDSTTTNDTSSYLFSSNASSIDQGFMTTILTNGEINKVEGKVIFNGNLVVHLPVLEEAISIPVHNLFILDQNVDSGQNLTTLTDSLTQTINFSGQDLPITFNYTLQTIQGDSYDNHTVKDMVYDNVISSNLQLDLSATVSLSVFNIAILLNQTVLNSTNYFAENIGMIESENDIHLEFEDLSEYSVPQIPSIIGTSRQVLLDYKVQ